MNVLNLQNIVFEDNADDLQSWSTLSGICRTLAGNAESAE
jgi:hypothetical protein